MGGGGNEVMQRVSVFRYVELGALDAEKVQRAGMEGPQPVLARGDDDTLP
jgi:hypothetical protein